MDARPHVPSPLATSNPVPNAHRRKIGMERLWTVAALSEALTYK